MDVFPDLVGENEFLFFDDETYKALENVMDDLVASYLKTYCANPDANPVIVNAINEHLSSKIKSLTFHLDLQERGIVDLISKLSPESILTLDPMEIEDIKKQLTYLNDNISYLMPNIPGCSKQDWANFLDAFTKAIARQSTAGVRPTYPNPVQRLVANKFVFYVPNSKGHSTRTGIINSKRRQWTMCLHGIRYNEYCEANHIDPAVRRAF